MSKYRVRATFILLVTQTLFWGCGNDSSSKSPAAAATELEGSWLASCFLNETESRRALLEISGNTITKTVSNFSDSACSTAGDWGYKTTATFSIGSELSNDLVAVDSTLQTFSKIPATEIEAETFNNDAHCGLTGWAAGEATDVTGRDL